MLELVEKVNLLLKEEDPISKWCYCLFFKWVGMVQNWLIWQYWLSRPPQHSTVSLFCCNSGWRGILIYENPKLVLRWARSSVAGISLVLTFFMFFSAIMLSRMLTDGQLCFSFWTSEWQKKKWSLWLWKRPDLYWEEYMQFYVVI